MIFADIEYGTDGVLIENPGYFNLKLEILQISKFPITFALSK